MDVYGWVLFECWAVWDEAVYDSMVALWVVLDMIAVITLGRVLRIVRPAICCRCFQISLERACCRPALRSPR